MKKRLLLSISASIITSLFARHQDYDKLKTVLPECHTPCWFTTGHELTKELSRIPGKNLTVIEIGCFLGTSTTHMAQQPRVKTLYAVDHWEGTAGFESCPVVGPMLSTLYEQFLSNVVHKDLTDVIVPVRLSSLEAAEKLKEVKADLIYVDGDHDEAPVYADLCAWHSKLKPNGVMCGDDWGGYVGVRAAVTRFAQENGYEIYTDRNFWKLYR